MYNLVKTHLRKLGTGIANVMSTYQQWRQQCNPYVSVTYVFIWPTTQLASYLAVDLALPTVDTLLVPESLRSNNKQVPDVAQSGTYGAHCGLHQAIMAHTGIHHHDPTAVTRTHAKHNGKNKTYHFYIYHKMCNKSNCKLPWKSFKKYLIGLNNSPWNCFEIFYGGWDAPNIMEGWILWQRYDQDRAPTWIPRPWQHRQPPLQ